MYKRKLSILLAPDSPQVTLLHKLLDEVAVEVAADGVVDEALLLVRLVARLVAEHDVVVPPALDLS